MSTPYYEDALVQLWHGDCHDLWTAPASNEEPPSSPHTAAAVQHLHVSPGALPVAPTAHPNRTTLDRGAIR